MDCQDISTKFADYLAGTLSDADLAAVREHLRGCASCRDELAALDETWQALGEIGPEPADSAALRARFDAALAGYRHATIAPDASPAGRSRAWMFWQGAAAAAVLVVGVFIGRASASHELSAGDPQIGALRTELGEVREILTLSLLQQQSASERLKGVSSTAQLDEPGNEVVAALLDTLMHDENVNVRLATIDALQRFAARDVVRRGAIAALPRQTSPLVQIALIDFVAQSAAVEGTATLRAIAHDSKANDAVRTRATRALQQLGEPL
jgi:hypothetical protein